MQQIEHLQNLLKQKKREFTRKYCLHPEAPKGCSHSIVAAHSVQRAILKKHIAINGHVVHVKVSPHVDPVGFLVKPEEIGINEATTFFGYCGAHDAALFRPLESSMFEFKPNQISLLGYRAVSRELYQKDAEIATAEAVKKYAAMHPGSTRFKEMDERHSIQQMARLNAKANLLNAREQYASMMTDDTQLRYYAVQFAGAPVFMCSVAFLPEWDFEGRQLQDLQYIAEYKPLCFSAWATGNQAAAVFCWHKSADNICEPLIASLRRIPHNYLANRILSMAFEVSENVVFRSDWWEAISEDDRQRIVARAMSGVGHFERDGTCLADDGLSAISLGVDAEYLHHIANRQQ